MEITQIVAIILIAIVTILYISWKVYKNGLRKTVVEFIVKAEDIYEKGANQEKINYVIDKLIALIPAPFSLFITRECIKKFIQKVFDETKKALDYKKGE